MKIRGAFKAGDDVPSWLFDITVRREDPRKPWSVRFGVSCSVLETSDSYIVVPERDRDVGRDNEGPKLIIVEGGGALTMARADKRVVLPIAWQVVGSDGFDGRKRRDMTLIEKLRAAVLDFRFRNGRGAIHQT